MNPVVCVLQSVPLRSLYAGTFGIRLEAKTGRLQIRSGGGSIDTPQADDVALFLHTSGTTSRPKGVPLNQGNLAASLANIAGCYELTPDDRSLLVMPLFHVHGLMAGMGGHHASYRYEVSQIYLHVQLQGSVGTMNP